MTKDSLKNNLISLGYIITDEQMDQFEKLATWTLEVNKVMNLTAIKELDVFYEKMIYDSALAFINLPLEDKEYLDFGTGAGFPGIVAKILYPSVNLTLLDATKKKCDNLQKLCEYLKIPAKVVNFRGEEYAAKHIEEYDYVSARAVADLRILLEIVAPLLKINGTFIALKGLKGYEEFESANNALKVLNLRFVRSSEFLLPESKEVRINLFFTKDAKTNKKYPRPYRVIDKKPL